MVKERLNTKEILIVASTLFGLFFGAGNIIFPVSMGQLSGANVWQAVLGFILTAVGLPLLGVAAMGMSHSQGVQDLSQKVSKAYSYFFTLALYLTIGPFFAIPRTATVSFEVGLAGMVPSESSKLWLWLYTAVFFALAYLLARRPGKILDYVGRYLNPSFLVLLAIIIVVGFWQPLGNPADIVPDPLYQEGAFTQGILEGYNTMDALASLAFGIIIVNAIRSLGVMDPSHIGIETVKSGLFAILAMGIIYACLALLGAQSRGLFPAAENGGIAIAQITSHYFGAVGLLLLAIIMFVACLKTAVGLIVACSETFYDLFGGRLALSWWTVIVTLVSFLAANVGLTNIIAFSLPVLMLLYPLAIVLIVLALFDRYIIHKSLYKWVTAFTLIPALFDFVKTLPAPFYGWVGGDTWQSLGSRLFPLYDYGFAWLVPGLIGLIVGLLFIQWQKRKN